LLCIHSLVLIARWARCSGSSNLLRCALLIFLRTAKPRWALMPLASPPDDQFVRGPVPMSTLPTAAIICRSFIRACRSVSSNKPTLTTGSSPAPRIRFILLHLWVFPVPSRHGNK
jgi:hypothetical protein